MHLPAPAIAERSAAPAILAAAATGIVPYIERQGGDIDRIFGNAGLAPEMTALPTLKLSLTSFCSLFEEAAVRTGNPSFGLWFGNAFTPRDLGLWGYAAVSAPTLRAALETLVRLFPYHQGSSRMALRGDPSGLMRLEYGIEAASILDRRQDAELSLGMFQNVMRECLGARWTAEEVHFAHPRLGSRAEHERAFGAPVYFSQARNALLFRPELLARPMPARDPRLMAMMSMCLEQLSGGRGSERLIDRVRAGLQERLSEGAPALDEMAERLRVAPSALRRELDREGTTYRELVEEARRELALRYLGESALAFSEIAYLVGYSELSAFSRAVRRWTGESPRRVRQRSLPRPL